MSPETLFRERVSSEIKRTDERLDTVTDELAAIQREQLLITKQLEDSMSTLKQVQCNTQDMIKVFESWKGAMKVLEWIGKMAKPLIYIVGLGTAIFTAYATIKSGITK